MAAFRPKLASSRAVFWQAAARTGDRRMIGGFMAVIVRQAHEDDVQVLSRLIGELQGLHAEAIPSRFKQPNDNTFPPSKVLDRLSRPQATFLICDVDSAPAGYIYLDVIGEPENDGSFRVHTLYVAAYLCWS